MSTNQPPSLFLHYLFAVVRLIKILKILSFQGCVAQAKSVAPKAHGYVDADYNTFCVSVFTRLLRTLFARWSRHPFCCIDVWLVEDTEDRRVRREIESQTPLGLLLLNLMPFVIPFHERMRIFERWLAAEK